MKNILTAEDTTTLQMIASGYTARQVAEILCKQYHVIAGNIERLRVRYEAKNTTHLIVILIGKHIIRPDEFVVPEVKKTTVRPAAVYSNSRSAYL